MASQAVVAAFKKRPPKNPGILTSVSSKDETEFFIDTIKYLKLAGYEVKESNA